MIGSPIIRAAHLASRGFSVSELIIIVIGIVSAVTVTVYNGVREKAQATAIVAGFKQIDDAFTMWAVKDKLTEWPKDPVLGGGVALSQMLRDYPTLAKYLTDVPSVPEIQEKEWFYDNDMDSGENCTNTYSGTNVIIMLNSDNRKLATMVDEQMDDGNLTCGHVRYENNRIFLSISNSWRVEKRE